jgi:hypothetical protein
MLSCATRAKSVINKVLKKIHTFYTYVHIPLCVGHILYNSIKRQLRMPTTNLNNYIIEDGNQNFHTQDFFTFQ